MNVPARLVPVLFLFLFTLPHETAAQEFGENVTVEVVEVPVFVTRGDKSVSGLTKDDFELVVNGKRREIEYFDVMMFDRARAADAPQIEVNRRRLFLLLFDLDHSSYRSLKRAVEAAHEFVHAGAERGDAFAVATYARGGMRFLIPFSNSEFAVRRALARLAAPISAAGEVHVAPGEESSVKQTGADGVTGPESIPQSPEEGVREKFDAEFAKDLEKLPKMETLDRELSTAAGQDLVQLLTGIADELQTLPGQKHVVLLSEGPGLSLVRGRNLTSVVRMHDRFRAAGAFLHALGIKGMEARSTLFSTSLHTLALDTGGKVIQDTNRLKWALGTIREIQNVTYIIGFKPTENEARRSRNEINVRLKNKPFGTEVRYRKGFSGKAPDRELSRLYVAHVLANDVPHDEIEVEVFVSPRDGNLVVGARIDGSAITHAANGSKVTADVYLYVFDERGSVVAWSEKKLAVDFAKAADFYLKEKLVASHEFAFTAGRYSAKAFVHFDTLQLSGFDRAAFTVAERSASR